MQIAKNYTNQCKKNLKGKKEHNLTETKHVILIEQHFSFDNISLLNLLVHYFFSALRNTTFKTTATKHFEEEKCCKTWFSLITVYTQRKKMQKIYKNLSSTEHLPEFTTIHLQTFITYYDVALVFSDFKSHISRG